VSSNPVERMWDALAAGDWRRAETELHPHVVVEWPHTGERFESPEAFLLVHRKIPDARQVRIRSVITEGRRAASEVWITDQPDAWAVTSFFTLHDGHILRAVEYWTPLPG
jgi:ketosteroid isomerase-like protein